MIEKTQDTKLLGGQEIWDKHNKKVSAKLEALGMTSEEVTQIFSGDEIFAKIVELCFAAGRPSPKSATTPEVAAHIPKGWTVLKDVALTLSHHLKIKFISFLERGEVSVHDKVMCERAVKLGGNLGLADARWLVENRQLIPAELRGRKYIIFPGTVLRDSIGYLYVPYLLWDDGRWILNFRWLEDRWIDLDCLVSCMEELGS